MTVLVVVVIGVDRTHPHRLYHLMYLTPLPTYLHVYVLL